MGHVGGHRSAIATSGAASGFGDSSVKALVTGDESERDIISMAAGGRCGHLLQSCLAIGEVVPWFFFTPTFAGREGTHEYYLDYSEYLGCGHHPSIASDRRGDVAPCALERLLRSASR
jgi:hypothetical protein